MIDMGPDHALLRLGEALKRANYRHITVTPATHNRVNARSGNEWANDLNGIFGWSRPFREQAVAGPIFALMQQARIVEPWPGGWRSLLRASTLGGNLYFHSAWPTDTAGAVFFGPDTYRYVGAMTQHFCALRLSPGRAADIGCGAGPGAIELAQHFPQAEIVAVDINSKALQLSRVNAALAGVAIQTVSSNLLSEVEGSFDLLVANPPYLVDPEARAYRHGGGSLGAGLSLNIIDTALHRLRPGGTLILYTGSAIVDGNDLFLHAATQLLQDRCSWSYREIDPDVFGEELGSGPYSGADRIAAVLLCVTMPA